jgi:hypothetical protein
MLMPSAHPLELSGLPGRHRLADLVGVDTAQPVGQIERRSIAHSSEPFSMVGNWYRGAGWLAGWPVSRRLNATAAGSPAGRCLQSVGGWS